jgi:hypothetical protein
MTRQELDAFIHSALETLPERTTSTDEARAVLIAEGIITADGELAAEYREAVSTSCPVVCGPEHGGAIARAAGAFSMRFQEDPAIEPPQPWWRKLAQFLENHAHSSRSPRLR